MSRSKGQVRTSKASEVKIQEAVWTLWNPNSLPCNCVRANEKSIKNPAIPLVHVERSLDRPKSRVFCNHKKGKPLESIL